MYYENKIISDPPDKKSAVEICKELQNEFNKQQIDLKICSLYLKNKNEKHQEKGDDQFQNQWKYFMINNTYWWDTQYQEALNGKDIKRINCIIHPQLLNEIPPFLAKFQDYYQLIEQILQKTQEELFAIPTHNPRVTSSNILIKPPNNQQNDCHIRLLGQKEDFDRLNGSDNKFYIFGELVQIKNSLKNNSTQFFKKQSVRADQNNNVEQINNDLEKHYTFKRLRGSDFQFGYKTSQHNTNKFHVFWALDQIRKHYPQQVDIENTVLQISGNVAHIYFELLINQVRRVHFKIEFLLTKGQNKKMIKGNLCHSDGSVIIEKDKDIMHFYLRVQNYPKCYIHESLKLDQYHEPQYREWWRCQNFIINDMTNLIAKCILKNTYQIRFSVTDFKNKDFLEFCQMIEKEGFLQQYHPSKIFNLKKFSDLELQQYIHQIQLDLNWALVSAIFGRVKLIQPSFSIEKFIEQFQKYDQGQLALIINNLRKEGVTNTLTQNDFHQIMELKANEILITKQKTIMQGFITPSQIVPNYQINEYFPLIETNILLYQNRNKLKSMPVRTNLIKFSLRDDSLLKITQRQLDVPYHFQNKILIDAYFRTQLKKELKIMDQTFEFIGFSSKSLKNNECYFINSQIAYIVKQSLFSNLGYISSKLECAVKCRHFQRVLDEFFQSICKIVRFSDLENNSDTHNIIRIKKNSKHPNKKQENAYGFRVLKPQGKISQDLMSKITDDNQSCVFMRWKSYTGIMVANKNPNKYSQITFYEAMAEKQSPSSEQHIYPHHYHCEKHQRQIDLQNLKLNFSAVLELQIIAYPKYRPCLLELHHVLNIYNENLRTYVRCYYGMYSNEKSVQKLQTKLTKYYAEMKQQCPKLQKYRNEFRLPIKKGAYLTAVYDSRLSPEEIFIQIEDEIVKEKEIMVFKKKYLLDDGVQVFSSVEDEGVKESLKKQYRNVIVFSTHFICSRFAFDQFDQKQRFFAIWDPLLMVEKSEIYPIDCEITYNKLKYQPFSILNDSLHSSYKEIDESNMDEYDFKGWLPVLYNQLIDYFTLFQSSQNIQELKQMYCTIKIAMTLNEYLYKTKQEQFTSALQQIQLANYQYLWYADTQAAPPIFPRTIREIFQMVNYGDINDMVQLLFLD